MHFFLLLLHNNNFFYTMRNIFSLFLMFFTLSVAYPQGKDITLEEIYRDGVFRQRTVQGIRSMNDGEHYTTLVEGRHIVKYAYQTGNAVDTLLSLQRSAQYGINRIAGYEFSSDERQILVHANVRSIYRRSFLADYYVWNIAAKTLTSVSDNGSQQVATFSPDGTKIAFVRDNNIYVKPIGGVEFAVTTDGVFNEIINGAPDWVYEEEFSFSRAYEWSPDSRRIAWIRFDERDVPLFNMEQYGDRLYPEWYTFKYPKAGETNSIVSVHIYDLQDKSVKTVDVGNDKEQYIPRLIWTANAGRLCVLRINRLQNRADLLLADAMTGAATVLYTETNRYFVELKNNFVNFTPDGNYFYMFSERNGYSHIYLHDMRTGREIRPVTSGNFDVANILGYHHETQRFYYIAADESPLTRNVFSVGIDGRNPVKINTHKGTNNVVFSSNYTYFINNYSDANTPLKVALYNQRGELVRMLEENPELTQKTKEYGFVEKEFMTIVTRAGVSLNAYMMKPADMQPGKQYPLFMYVYGGPASQTVLDSWDASRMAWFQLLVQKGYIVVSVDNRGTGCRGEEFRKGTYLQLGKYETIDQIDAAVYFGGLPYIDASRIGIFGWSYGGYMAALCLTIGADVFKLGIAVAPVTNWRFYDTIYTERYMRTPQENPDGYDDNSPINHVEKMTGKFLLIHGSADDNVHLQNTMVFAEKLVQANKQFDMMIYTDRNHGISGGNTSLHLNTMMTNFILNNL